MNGEIAVSHILRNDADVVALVEQKVYLEKPAQLQLMPFIVVEVRNFSPVISKSGKAEKDIDTIEVMIYSSSRKVLKDIVEAVRVALDHIPAAVHNSVSVEQIVFENAFFSHESETNKEIYSANMAFEIWVIL